MGRQGELWHFKWFGVCPFLVGLGWIKTTFSFFFFCLNMRGGMAEWATSLDGQGIGVLQYGL